MGATEGDGSYKTSASQASSFVGVHLRSSSRNTYFDALRGSSMYGRSESAKNPTIGY